MERKREPTEIRAIEQKLDIAELIRRTASSGVDAIALKEARAKQKEWEYHADIADLHEPWIQ